MSRAALALFAFVVSASVYAQEPPVDVIVEFRDPPLAVRRLPLSAYRANFDRLRRDVRTPQGKTALPPLIRREYFEAFHGAALRVPQAAVDELRALPYVKRVQRDMSVEALTETNIEAVGAVKTWNTLGTRGAGVTVAIIDTGIDYTHPALHNVTGGWDFVNDDSDPMDDQGHGTHVAGIVAANLDSFTGVAPDAKLVAYKVLDERGRGTESDVIAAIERALDPNGDGDLSDHASVANLSLGGDGNPDDAVSIAVDNAVAAGMVVCVAAGNSGAFHAVSSPGTARDAITVGAVDSRDVLATFSSKGPAAKLASIKPDVVAPGVSIRSTYLNGGYATLSGTSMATPHVAGAAALLRAIHPDWSPAEVKSALVMYAKSIDDEPMSQGGGRIDIARAAQATILASPASISFGLDTQTGGTFQKTQSIHITNRGTKSESVALAIDGAQHGVTVSIDPPKLELAAGASADATVSIAVANDDSAVSSDSYAFSGLVHIDTASASTHTPWAVVKAARATVVTDMNLIGQFWVSGAKVPSAVTIDDHATETLLPPGDYDLLLASTEGTPLPAAESLVVLEHQPVRGDVTINATRSLAAHAMAFDGVDANGARLFRASSYVQRMRVVMPDGSFVKTIDLPSFNLPSIRVSDLSPRFRVLAMETLFDREHATFTSVSHHALNGITADVDLMNAPSDLRHAPVTFPGNRDVTFTSIAGTKGVSTKINTNAADLYMTQTDPAFPSSFSISASDVLVPSISVRGDRIEIGSAYAAADGEPLHFGTGPVFPRLPVTVSNSRLSPPFGFIGQLGDYRTAFDTAGFFTVTNANGTLVAAGTPMTNAFYLAPGTYTIDDTVLLPLARAEVTATIDTTVGDTSAPVLTSMYIADAGGRAVTSLAPLAIGTLRFAADVTAVKAWIRSSGDWVELPVAIDGGNRYHADLPTNAVAAVGLKIELAANGNRMTYTLAPAFTVGDVAQLPRRRP